MGSCKGHWGAGAGLEMGTLICPSFVCNGKGACGRTPRGSPELGPAAVWRRAEGRAICGSSGGMASLGSPAAARSLAL